MRICMAGIDFNQAPLTRREAFAFTKTQAQQGLRTAAAMPGVEGCVLVSTCNRTELWLYAEPTQNPAALLLRLRGLPADGGADLTVREGMEAVRHLFETACGLRSRIWGEDQIISQVRDAAALAVAEHAAGRTLGKLFQAAVTSAKRVKTEVRFSAGGASAAQAAVDACHAEFGSLSGRQCLVIGSGTMGRLSAQAFLHAGAQVTMTLRKYKHGLSAVPAGCASLSYDDRLQGLSQADLIVSATASPHHTLHAEAVAAVCTAHPRERILLDLAVPRDIDPAIASIPGCRLLTIDDLSCDVRDEERAAVERQCRQIINHYIGEFQKQQTAWSTLPAVARLSGEFERRFLYFLADTLKGLPPDIQEDTLRQAGAVARREAQKLLFSFRDWMEAQEEPTIPETEHTAK